MAGVCFTRMTFRGLSRTEMGSLRRIEVLHTYKGNMHWTVIGFRDLEKGDLFRCWESDKDGN